MERLSVMISFTAIQHLTEPLFIKGSYYIVLAMLATWSYLLYLYLQGQGFGLHSFLKNQKGGFALALFLAIAVFLSVPVGFKTLADETNMLSVSRSMVLSKTCSNITMAENYYGNLHPITSVIDKRSLIFPFLLHLLHLITGFRYQNAFVLNFVIFFCMLWGIFAVVKSRLDVSSAAGAMFLTAACPVITIFATSGGFDLLNTALFLLVIVLTIAYIEQSSLELFRFLLITLVVFANVRYESIVYLLLVPLLVGKIRWGDIRKSMWLLTLMPMFCLPYILQRILRGDTYQNPENTPLFSLQHLRQNFILYVQNMPNLKNELPYAGLLNVLGTVFYLSLLITLIFRKTGLSKTHLRSVAVVTLMILAGTTVFMSHFFGNYTHPSSVRFFMILSLVLAMGPVVMRMAFPKLYSGLMLLFFAVISFVYYHPIAMENRCINALTLNREMKYVMGYLSDIDDPSIMIISSRPNLYTAIGCGAVDFFYVNQNSERLRTQIKKNLFSRVIAIQEVQCSNCKPTSDTALLPVFHIRPLSKLQHTASTYMQISEVEVWDYGGQ